MALRERDRTRARERLEALADAELDPESACRAAIDVLRPVVGFDRWCWPLTDPGSALSASGTADFDLWPELPRIAVLEEHGDVTRKPALVTGERATVTLSGATEGDLARSTRWRECMRPYGVGDELMAVCRDRHGCWGSVELMRDAGDRAFGEDEVAFMEDVAPVLATAIRQAQQRAWRWDENEPPARAPATVILDSALRPASWTATASDWLSEGMLPPAVYELGARVLTPAAEATDLPARVRIRTPAGRWATFEGAQLEGESPGHVAITIREASPDEVLDLLCKTYDLTVRERQLVTLIRAGLATKQLAQAMCISPYTVQDHLKAIFAKTGARSRGELVSHLAGGR